MSQTALMMMMIETNQTIETIEASPMIETVETITTEEGQPSAAGAARPRRKRSPNGKARYWKPSPKARQCWVYLEILVRVLRTIDTLVKSGEKCEEGQDDCWIWNGAGRGKTAVVSRPCRRSFVLPEGTREQIRVRELLHELSGAPIYSKALKTPTLGNTCNCSNCVNPAHSYWRERSDIYTEKCAGKPYDAARAAKISLAYRQRKGVKLFTPEEVKLIRESPKSIAALCREKGWKKDAVRNCRNGVTYRADLGHPSAPPLASDEDATMLATPFSGLMAWATSLRRQQQACA